MKPIKLSRKLYIRIALIIALVGLVISVAGGLASYFAGHEQHIKLTERLVGQLAQSSRKTAAIAVYLNDEELAREIINGLLLNDLVIAAQISDMKGVLAAGPQAGGQKLHSDLTLYHPFVQGEVIGKLQVYADADFIRRMAVADATRGALQMLVVSLLITIAVSWVMFHLLTRPISQMTQALMVIDPNSPENLTPLEVDYRHKNEIGQMIGRINGLISALRDKFVQEKSLRLQTEELQHRFRLLFERASAGIALMSLQRGMVAKNQAFESLLGEVDSLEDFAALFADSQQVVRVLEQLSQDNQIQQASLDLKFLRQGEPHWIHCLFAKISDQRLSARDEQDVLIELIVNDITERMAREEQAQYEASHDALTKLYNRRGGKEALQNLWASTGKDSRRFVLMVIDLDQFKPINDTYGHDVGDQVLISVSHRLHSHLSTFEHVCMRWGGDEFIAGMLMEGPCEQVAGAFCNSLRVVLAEPVDLGDQQSVSVTASIGFVVAGPDDQELESLISRADEMMYRVKKHTRIVPG